MEKIFKIQGILFILFLTSCTDILNVDPPDKISQSSFWKTPSDAQYGLDGVYSRLKSTTFNNEMAYRDIFGGDIYTNDLNWLNIVQGKAEPNSGRIGDIWNNCFRGIASCNIFLANIDNVTTMPDVDRNLFKGRVRFLRALFYHTLTDYYGGVPLYLQPVDGETARVKQSTNEQVVAAILADLNYAISVLPEVKYDGYAVRGSARALRGKVLLYNRRFAEAAAALDSVIQTSTFSIYNGGFPNLFIKKGQINNPEIIFSTKYSAPNDASNQDQAFINWAVAIPFQSLVDEFEYTGTPNPTNPFVNRDPRCRYTIRLSTEPYVRSDGFSMMQPHDNISFNGYQFNKCINVDYIPVTNDTKSDEDWVLIRYADVLLMYAEAKNEVSGPDQSVFNAINAVRSRQDVKMPTYATGSLTKDQMTEKIRHERRVEFAFEGYRYSDIRRWGIAKQVLEAVQFPGGAKAVFDNAKNNVFPIPQTERDLNPQLDQNPGYFK